MEPLDRFLTCLLKELKTSGFVETLGKYAEYAFKKGFETLAETAARLLKEIITFCFSCFKRFSSFASNNPIFKIIYDLIIKFYSATQSVYQCCQTIIQYINTAIDLLNKLLRKFGFKNGTPSKIIEVTSDDKMAVPCKSCSFKNDVNTNRRENIEVNSIPTTAAKITPISTNCRANTEVKSIPITPAKIIPINTRNRADVKVNSIPMPEAKIVPININCRTNTEVRSIPITPAKITPINTRSRADVEVNSMPMPEPQIPLINTNHRENMEVRSIPETEIKNKPQNKTISTIVGTRRRNNTNFKGVERKISYYVGGVSLNTSEQSIIAYLTNIIPGGYFECVKLNSNGKIQSFKVTANWSSKKRLENPSSWPEGVRVRPWIQKNKLSSNILLNETVVNNCIGV